MKKELLIIMAGEDYIRVTDSAYDRCGMEKASVYPVNQLDKVEEITERMEQSGIADVSIKKLIITQEDLS